MNTDNLTSALNLLAEKLGVAVNEIYGVLIAQARVVAIKTPLLVLCYGLIIFAAVLLAKKCFFEKKYENYCGKKVSLMQHLNDGDDAAALVVLVLMNLMMCVVAIVLSIKIVNTISACVTAWVNPKFWALDYILETVG